jgi:hypothetical protein
MRRQLLRFLLLILTPTLVSCMLAGDVIRGSGDIVTNEYDLTDFSAVEVGWGCDLDIRASDAYGVVVEIDDNLEQHLQVDVRAGTLTIGLDPTLSYTNAHLRAEVTLPRLDRLDLSGGSDGQIGGFESARLIELVLSGGSELRGTLSGDDVRIDASGGSTIDLAGTAENLRLDASGGSNVRLFDFAVNDVKLNVSGGSDAELTVNGALSGEASGGGDVTYDGDPSSVAVDVSGGSNLRRR